MSYRSLPLEHRANGEARRVGFELEFTGMDFDSAARALQQSLTGELTKQSEVEWTFNAPEFGKFKIELDWTALKNTADNGKDEQQWITFLRDSAALVVPLEVVFPPLRFDQLSYCDTIVGNLRKAGAQGTEGSPIAAYGVHINTELAVLDLSTVLNYLRAFCLLQWWLVKAHSVDMTRRISPYVDLYPEKYVRNLLSKPPQSMDKLIDDYLEHNATRNRALDMLPLFSAIDTERVKAVIDDERIGARETFHYRLPNCEIDRPDWYLSEPWNIWTVLENLASDTQALNELTENYLDRHRLILGVKRTKWVKYLQQWLQDREWV
ncbi:MAG: hypothetical protein CMP91_03940 [Gammaproteobacteria bacterium]|nr:hypothetical protein [Gammaproteobacteria bacterium]|tara:strand:+ start:297 stop:1262 length:966 start_codon:yes stop_codon:yes gene_type:complete